MDLLAATLLQQKLEYYLALPIPELVREEFQAVKVKLSVIIPHLRSMNLIIDDQNAGNRRQELKGLEDVVDNIMISIQRSPMMKLGHRLSFFQRVVFYMVKQRVGLKKQLREVQRLGQKIQNHRAAGGTSPTTDAAEEVRSNSLLGSENYALRVSPSAYRSARSTIHEDVADRIEDLLLNEDDSFKVIGVIGSKGIGKSTLVLKVYDGGEVRKYFDCYAWISNPSSLEPENILREILRQFYFGSAPYPLEDMDQEALLSTIHKDLTDKKFLLVLDGVSAPEIWERVIFPAFPFGSELGPLGSIVFENKFKLGRILFTSSTFHRKIFDTLVNQVYVQIHLEASSSEEIIWPLFCDLVFPDTQTCPTGLEEIGRAIANKSQGITFVLRLLAGALRGQSSTELWRKRLHQLNYFADQLKRTDQDVTYKAILLSYYALASPLKSCFLYFSIFPKDTEIPLKRVIRLWVAEGLVVEETPKRTATGEETPKRTATEVSMAYLQELINRDLIHPARIDVKGDVETCKLDDQVHRVAFDIIGSKLGVQSARTDNNTGLSSASSGTERIMLAGSPLLSINLGKDSIEGITEKKNAALIRSCIISGKGKLGFLSAFQLLRVLDLDLEGSEMETLPDSLGSLVHLIYLGLKGSRLKEVPSSALKNLILLKYLGLRRTGIRELPAASLLHLTDLHTLDVRDTKLRILPGSVTQLLHLQHIYLCSSFRREFVEMPLRGKESSTRQKVVALDKLQTLAGVRATDNMIEELGSWGTQLRKLSIGRVTEAHSKKLCSSINKMNFLRSLSITSDINESLHMGSLAPKKDLDTLRIGGSVQAFEHVIDCFPSLCRLFLWDNLLEDDPLPMLEKLPNLMVLSLTNTFQGKEIRCRTDGFPKLETLSIFQMRSLESWQIKGGMQKLERLSIGHCPKLKEPLQDIESLPNLLLVKVADMEDFAKKIETIGKTSKHVFKVRHVPLFKSTSESPSKGQGTKHEEASEPAGLRRRSAAMQIDQNSLTEEEEEEESLYLR